MSEVPKLIQLIVAVLIAIVTLAYSLTAGAVIAHSLSLTNKDLGDLKRVEAHLNSIKTMHARFLQMSSDGAYSEGTIYLSRPGRMRIEYDPPSPVMIIADGSSLIYIDKEIEQATAIFLRLSPAHLILQENLSLSSEKILITGFKRSPGVIRLSMVRADSPLDSQITLIFSDAPLELRKWSIKDTHGVKTTVSLIGSRFGVILKKELFDYDTPGPIHSEQ